MAIFFLQIQDQARLARSLTMVTSAPCILNAPVNVRTNLYNYFMHSYIYGVLLCVKFNKNTLDGFEGLQGLWRDGRMNRAIPIYPQTL
jgi:hypothetical protein